MAIFRSIQYASFRAFLVLWSALALASLYVAGYSIGAAYEGRWFPVVDHERVVEVSVVDASTISILIEVDKVRACGFLEFGWYSGNPGEAFKRATVVDPRPATRPTGAQYLGPWTIAGMGRGSLMFGVVRHDCGWPWATETTIGPFENPLAKVDPRFVPSGDLGPLPRLYPPPAAIMVDALKAKNATEGTRDFPPLPLFRPAPAN